MSAAVEELIRQWLTQRAAPIHAARRNKGQGALTPEDVALVQRLAARMGVLLDRGSPAGLQPDMAIGFLDLLPVVVVIKDPDGRVLWANRHYLELTSKSLPELKGKTAVDIWGQYGEEIRKHERLVLTERKGRAFVEEVPVGDVVRLRETLRFPIFDESGNVVSMIGVLALDLLQAFRAYDEFSGHPQPGDLSSIPYRFLRFLPIPVLIVDSADRVQYANEAYTAAIGKGLGEIMGGSLGEHWPAEVAAGMVEENRRLRCGAAPSRLSVERLRIRGKIQERMCLRFAIPKETGGPPLVAALGFDFKKIGAAATLLEEVQKGGTAFIPLDAAPGLRETGPTRKCPTLLLDAFFAGLPAVATVKDTLGRIVYANLAYEKLTGKEVESVRGQLPTHHWPTDVAELIMTLDRWVRSRGKPMLSVERIPVQGALHNRVTIRFPIFRRVEVEATASLGLDFDYIESRVQRWAGDPPKRSGVYSLEDDPLS